jgi:hypothetical protein
MYGVYIPFRPLFVSNFLLSWRQSKPGPQVLSYFTGYFLTLGDPWISSSSCILTLQFQELISLPITASFYMLSRLRALEYSISKGLASNSWDEELDVISCDLRPCLAQEPPEPQ